MKMISLTKLKGSGLWEFLEPVLISEVPLSRAALVARVVADRNLLQFIMEMVKEAVSSRVSYRTMFGFYMATLLEAINKHGLSENMLRDMWPYIISGLASSDENYQTSTIMILATACWRATIAHQLVKGAIDTLIAHTPPHLHSNAIRALIMVVQNTVLSTTASTKTNPASQSAQKEKSELSELARSNAIVSNFFSEDTISVLSSWSDAAQILAGFVSSQQYDATIFISFLLSKLAEDFGRDASRGSFLIKLFNAVNVPDLVPGLTVTLLKTFNSSVSPSDASKQLYNSKRASKNAKGKKNNDYDHEESLEDEDEEEFEEENNENIAERLAELMAAIDLKYPSQLDQGIATMIESYPSETKWYDLFEKGRHHGVTVQTDSGSSVSTTLTLCLRESLPTTQIFALSKLLELSTSTTKGAKTNELLAKTLLEHLKSKQPQLILNALAVPNLGDHVDAESLFDALENLTFFSQSDSGIPSKAFDLTMSLFLNPSSSGSNSSALTPSSKVKKAKSTLDKNDSSVAASKSVLTIPNAASRLMPMILFALFSPDETMRTLAGPAALRFHQHFLGRSPAQPCQTVFSHYSSSLSSGNMSIAHSVLALAQSAVANDDYNSESSSWYSIGANPRARTVFLLVLGCALAQVSSRKIAPHPSRTVEQETLLLTTVLLSHFSSDLHTMLISLDISNDVSNYTVSESATGVAGEIKVVGVPDWPPYALQSLLGSTPYYKKESFYKYTVWALLNAVQALAAIATPGALSEHLTSVAHATFKLLASAQVPSLFAPHFKTLLGFIGTDMNVAKFLEHFWLTPQASSCVASHTVILSPATAANSANTSAALGLHGSSTSALVCARSLAFLHALLNARVSALKASENANNAIYYDFAVQLATSLLVPLAHADSPVRSASLTALALAGQLVALSQPNLSSTPSKKNAKKSSDSESMPFVQLINFLVSKRQEFVVSETALQFALEQFFYQESGRNEDTHIAISRAERESLQSEILAISVSLPTTFAKYSLLSSLLPTPCGSKLDVTSGLLKKVIRALAPASETEGNTPSNTPVPTAMSADSDIFTFYLLDTLVKQWREDATEALNKSPGHFATLISSLRNPLEATLTIDPEIKSQSNSEKLEKGSSSGGKSGANATNNASKNSKALFNFSLQISCLSMITPEFFSRLSSPNQSKLFENLCELVLSPVLAVKEKVQAVIRSISVDPSTIVHELQACVEKTAPVAALDTAPPAKRSKSETSVNGPEPIIPEAVDPLEKAWIARVTVLLEMLQYKHDALRMGAHYVPSLFALLRNTAETENALAQDASAEYIEQLIFTTLINITEAIANGRAVQANSSSSNTSVSTQKDSAVGANMGRKNSSSLSANSSQMQVDESSHANNQSKEDEEQEEAVLEQEQVGEEALLINLEKTEFNALQAKYDVDCIIQIIRIRSNPTLQNNALLLLSHIARIYPAKVMSNVMSIFSFMGASTERSDDNYTFNVIEKTVERVIPALLAHSPGVEGKVSASHLLGVFVDRIDSIPQHRRLMLFTHLLTKILRRGYLPLVLALLLHKQSSHAVLDKLLPAPVSSIAQSASAALARSNYSGAIVTTAAERVSMADFALTLFHKLSPYECVSAIVYTLYWLNGFESKLERSPLVTGRTKDLSHTDKANMRSDVIAFAINYVTSKSFINQLLELSSPEQQRMQNVYLALFQALLVFAKFVAHSNNTSNTATNQTTSSTLDLIYKLTDRVNELMSIYTFFDAMSALFKQNDATIKHRALILFNERIKAVAKAERAGFDFGETTTTNFIQFTINMFKTVFSAHSDDIESSGVAMEVTNTGDNFSSQSSSLSSASELALAAALNKQTAALSVEIVSRLFGSKEEHAATFVSLTELVILALSPYVDAYQQHQKQLSSYYAQLQQKNQETALSSLGGSKKTKKGTQSSSSVSAPPTMDARSETTLKIQASLIVALATLISNARERVLPLVNKFFPLILGTLRACISVDSAKDPRQLLRQSCLAAIHVCVGVMHRFLSQYWPELLSLLLQPTDVFYGTSHWDGVVAILHLIGEVAPARVLIEPLEMTFKNILDYDPSSESSLSGNNAAGETGETFDKRRSACVQLLARMAGQISASLDRASVQAHHQHVFRIFLRFFEYAELTTSRSANAPTYASLVAVEETVIKSFMQLTLKLNETLFKPLFLVLLDWAKIQSSVAAVGLTSQASVASGANANNSGNAGSNAVGNSNSASENVHIFSCRSHLFYRLVCTLAEELKGIFVPYFSYILDHAIRVVLQPAHALKKSDPLLKTSNAFPLSPLHASGGFLVHQQVSLVVNGLQKLFLYDRDGFVDKSKFDKLLSPLVDQLECSYIEQYKSRVTHSIVPCIAQLAVCVGNEALWKPLNHKVLDKARHPDAQVRFSVLLVIGEFYHRVGEAFLPLLHESAQTFAELLEDSNPEVEKQCLALIKQIETVLGEDGGVMALLSK